MSGETPQFPPAGPFHEEQVNVVGHRPAQRQPSRVLALPDEALVLRWQRGDLAAASVAIQRYERMVYGSALRVLRDPHRAEDAAQETFLKAHERIGTLREPAALPGWLKRICVRHSIDQLRKNQPASIEDLEVPDHRPGPAAAAETADALERFRAALATLPESLRLVVSLRDVDGLSTAETAEALGITEAAAKMRLSRGRRELRAALSSDAPSS